MKRLILLFIILSVSIQVEAAKMSSYTNNTTPNDDVYFIGVDPNDTTQTANGSNYRYSLSSILGSGLLNFNVNSFTVSGTGDSWFELKNNTSFTDSLTGKYGIRFYNGVFQQILNGTATNIGSASIQELASDPAYTDLDTGEMAVSTASGDLFIKTATGLYTIAGTYTADPTTPTLTSLTIPAAGTTAEALFSEAMTIGAGGAGGWTLNDPTVAMTRTGGTGTVEDPVIFSLERTVLSTATENPYASYTQPTNGFESADDGVDLTSISNAAVTNNSTQTAESYTDVILHLNGDGAFSTPTYTLSATEIGPVSGTAASVATVNSTTPLVGPHDFSLPTSSDSLTFLQAFESSKFLLAFRIKLPTWASLTSGDFVTLRNSDGTRYCTVRPYNDGDTNEFQLAYREDGGAVRTISTDNANLSGDTQYIVVVHVDQSTPVIKLMVYDTAFTLLDEVSYTTAFTSPAGDFDRLYLYSTISLSTGVFIDNIMLSDMSIARNFVTDTISGVRMIDRNDKP